MVFSPGALKSPCFMAGGGHDVVEDQSLALPHPLVVDEEERFLLAAQEIGQMNGPAECAAELVALQHLALGREEVARVQIVVAHEFEHAAMKLVLRPIW